MEKSTTGTKLAVVNRMGKSNVPWRVVSDDPFKDPDEQSWGIVDRDGVRVASRMVKVMAERVVQGLIVLENLELIEAAGKRRFGDDVDDQAL